MDKIPVTVISGFAGAGKTTLLRHLLTGLEGKRTATFLSDLGHGEADNGLCETATPGIIHCKSREHLGMELRKLGRARSWDHLIIESTGGSEPLPVAECLVIDDGRGTPVSRYVQIDTLITVVDAERFLADYASSDTLKSRGLAASDGDARTVVEALVAQVELADVIVINKVDRAGEAQLGEIAAMLAELAPRAAVLRAEQGKVPVSETLNTGRFNFDAARELLGTSGWFDRVEAPAQGAFTSFGYRRFRPFHPARFEELIHGDWSDVVRSKGTFWVASRPDAAGEWWQAGKVVHHATAGSFWAATPESEWEIADVRKAKIKAVWQEPYGDRRQELALVVRGEARAAVERRLDACLLTDEEMALGPQGWTALSAQDHEDGHDDEQNEHAHPERFQGHSPADGHHMQ